MLVSCGVIFINTYNKKILMVHPTNQKFWDFPKGVKENNEQPKEAAIREVYEETGYHVDADNVYLYDLGERDYNKRKRLHMFLAVDVPDLNVNALQCKSTYFNRDNFDIPETDDFEWFTIDEAKERMCFSMRTLFNAELQPIIEGFL